MYVNMCKRPLVELIPLEGALFLYPGQFICCEICKDDCRMDISVYREKGDQS